MIWITGIFWVYQNLGQNVTLAFCEKTILTGKMIMFKELSRMVLFTIRILFRHSIRKLLKKESDTVNAVPELDVPFKIIRCHAVRVRLLMCVCMFVYVRECVFLFRSTSHCCPTTNKTA